METFSDLTINERCNIIVMVDEDSVKGNLNKDKLPNATYIGFTIRLDENLEKELTDKYLSLIHIYSFEIIKDFKVNNTIYDIVIFVNGFPFIIVEVKDKLKDAYNEISSYQNDIPNFFSYNAFSLLTDGKNALIGTVMASFASYKEWRMDLDLNPLEVLLTEFFKKERLMDYIKNSIFFKEKEAEKPVKLVGESYQYFGVLRVLDLINKYRIIENIKHKMRDGKVGLVLEKEGSKALFMAKMCIRDRH